MKKRRSPILAVFTLLIMLAACLAVLLAGSLAFILPQRVEGVFGPPAPGLDRLNRLYLALQLFLREDELTRPRDPTGPERPFQVELGESTAALVRRLQSEGFIASADAFRLYLQYTGLDTTLQAGDYQLSPAMTPIEIAQALQDATPTEVTFHILPGWRLEEIAASLPTSGLAISPETFQQAAYARPQGYAFSADLPTQATAEGFLFPDSYRLGRDLGVGGLLDILLKNFEAKLNPSLRQSYGNQNLDIYEAVTLASIVEREAVSIEEMPLIASVFLNRLALGMKLDTDPTVQYALGFNPAQQTWWTNPLSLEDLKIDSPYNTYLYPGLPPGPIANPGLEAMQAVAYPAQTPYYYFRSACDGSGRHVFAETFAEHMQNACP